MVNGGSSVRRVSSGGVGGLRGKQEQYIPNFLSVALWPLLIVEKSLIAKFMDRDFMKSWICTSDEPALLNRSGGFREAHSRATNYIIWRKKKPKYAVVKASQELPSLLSSLYLVSIQPSDGLDVNHHQIENVVQP